MKVRAFYSIIWKKKVFGTGRGIRTPDQLCVRQPLYHWAIPARGGGNIYCLPPDGKKKVRNRRPFSRFSAEYRLAAFHLFWKPGVSVYTSCVIRFLPANRRLYLPHFHTAERPAMQDNEEDAQRGFRPVEDVQGIPSGGEAIGMQPHAQHVDAPPGKGNDDAPQHIA